MQNSILLEGVSRDEFNSLIYKIDQLQQSLIQKPPKQLSDPYLTRRETADMLRISLPTLHMLVNTEKIKCYSIKGRRLFKKSEVEGSLVTLGAPKYRKA